MDIFEAICNRGSKRKYLQEPVPREAIEKCVEMAGHAPSPHNEQMWHFRIVLSDSTKRSMAEAVETELNGLFASGSPDPAAVNKIKWFSTFFKEAPVVVAVLMKPYTSVISPLLPEIGMDQQHVNDMRGNPDVQAVGAAIQNFLLSATALGYGCCWLSGPMVARKRIERLLKVSEPWRLEALITMGVPDGEVHQGPKKDWSEIISYVE
jgi:nitroreductase